MMRQQVIGSTHGGLRYLSEVLDLAAKGKVKPIVETFSLDWATDAYDRLASGRCAFAACSRPRKATDARACREMRGRISRQARGRLAALRIRAVIELATPIGGVRPRSPFR